MTLPEGDGITKLALTGLGLLGNPGLRNGGDNGVGAAKLTGFVGCI